MSDEAGARTRERVWIEKWDQTVDPPQLVEEVFAENGRIVAVRRPGDRPEQETPNERQHD